LGKFWWIFGTFRWCCFLFRVFFDLWGILRDFWWFLSFFGQEFWRSWLILGQMFEDVLVMFDDFLVTFGEFWWFCGISIMLWSIVFFYDQVAGFFRRPRLRELTIDLDFTGDGIRITKGIGARVDTFW
jgi:hypothetical protein